MFASSNRGPEYLASRTVEVQGNKTEEFMKYGYGEFTHIIYWQEQEGKFESGSTLVKVINAATAQEIKSELQNHPSWQNCLIEEVEKTNPTLVTFFVLSRIANP